MWRCTFDWEMTGVQEDTFCLLPDKKRLEHNYKDLDILPKVNKAALIGTIEAIEEYLRLHHGAMRAPFAYIIGKTIVVQTYVNILGMQLPTMR